MKKRFLAVAMLTVVLVFGANAQQNGWMSRYWDGCKQSCSWGANAGGIANACKECDRSNNRLVPTSDNNRSSCQGGNSYTCWDMIPYAVNDNLAYGFVATNPPNRCGECYEITFTGQGEHGTNDNHRAIQGKQMIVMAANIGGDVGNTQLDLMVPGGGLGLFDSFTGQTGISTSALGHQYGGILRQFCETGTAAAQRTCLRDRCNSVFSAANHDMLRRGCVFYADWLMAASNPRYTMRTVPCPQALRDIYSGAAIGGGSGGGGPGPTTFTLTVNRNPTGGGTTTPAATQANIAANTNVNISATAASGWTFSGWTAGTGATITNANTASTTVRLTANATITANFTQQTTQTHTLTVERSPTNGGTTTPASTQANISSGTAVPITATAATGFRFVNWTVVTGTATFANANNASTTVTLSANATIRANFVQTLTLTVNRNPDAGGTTTPTGAQANIAANTPISITASPASGYRFVNWTVVTGTATFANANALTTTVTLTANATIRANFTQETAQTFTLTVNRSPGAGGTTTPMTSQANISAGTAVPITATAASGYVFTNWTVTGSGATIANPTSAVTTVTLTANATITANFTQGQQTQTYSLTINRNPTAGGTVTGAGTHNANTPVNITATAASGYTFSNWTVTGSGATIANPNNATTTVNLTANATITANFTASGSGGDDGGFLEFTLNIRPAGSGRIDVSPNKALYLQGEPVRVVAVANSGFVFETWHNSDDLNGSNPEFNTNVWWHRAITAQFMASSTNVLTDVKTTSSARAQAMIVSAPRGFTAILPSNHTYTSYKLVDLRGREIQSGRITAGVTDLRFNNIRHGVTFLKLDGKEGPIVVRAVTY